jgi:hypothetical protein
MKRIYLKTSASGSRNLVVEQHQFDANGISTDTKRGIRAVDPNKADQALEFATQNPDKFSFGDAIGQGFYEVIYTP